MEQDARAGGGGLNSMRVVIATSTGFHLRHLAREFSAAGVEVEFHSYLPKWKTRQSGIPDAVARSHFLGLLPDSLLAVSHLPGARAARERLFSKADLETLRAMGPADVFIGLSGIAVESARRARDNGALVLLERGSSHILTQRDIALATGARPPSDVYIRRELAGYDIAHKVVVPSAFAMKSFIDQGFPAERLERQILATDLDLFVADDHVPSAPVKCLYVGNWSRRKGVELILELLARRDDLTISHIGTIDDVAAPDHPRLRLLGRLPPGQVAEQMRRHDLFLFPSLDDGFGMVLAEALASGLRVVASDASGGPDLAAIFGTQYVTIFPSGDAAAFVAGVDRQVAALLADPAARAAPQSTIDQISWPGYAARYLAMIDRLRGGVA